jgi:aminoglycoside phosphotransferase (APT) family kinase protein
MGSVLITSPSFTDEQRQQLSLALQPRVMAANLEAVFGRSEDNETKNGRSNCRILDAKYEPGEYCVILYQLGERMVIGRLGWNDADDKFPETMRLIAPLGMRAYLFPNDPALPGLATALDSLTMRHTLAGTLPDCRSGAMHLLRCQVTPLRYRPGRRCTLHLKLWLRDTTTGILTSRTLYGKIYHDFAKAASVYGEMRLLADSAPVQEGQVGLAQPVAFLPELPLILQEPVEGTPLDLLLGRMGGPATAGDPRGWSGVLRAASALAALHTVGLTTGRQRPIAAELRRFEHRVARVALVDPILSRRMGKLVAALLDRLIRLPEWDAEISLVHGDCKPSQFLLSPTQVALLDFDHCGMADPATDVGVFLATLRQLSVKQWLKARGSAAADARSRWLQTLEQAFLSEYCLASGRDESFRLRATWYEAVALLRKARRSFARSPGSPLPAELVDEAWRCLATLPPER